MSEEKSAKKGTITVDLDTLNALLDAKVEARLKEMRAVEVKPLDERFQDEMDALRGKQMPALPEETHACESPITGATFTARVLKSRSWPMGRIVELVDYKHPDGTDVHVADGGRCPDGKPIRHKDGSLTVDFKQWRYQEFWKRDLVDLVGKPFASYYSIEEADRRRAIDASRKSAPAAHAAE